ncbi:hypothetical protein SLE2022_133760 [Rubroshorea leprosula]
MADIEAPPDPNLTAELESLAATPMDPLFFSAPDSIPDGDLGFPLDDNGDFNLTFDEFDDLYFPLGSENFVIPDSGSPLGNFGDFTTESGSSAISGDRGPVDVDKYLKCSSPESGSCDRPDSSRVSSQGSGVSDAMNAASPDSGNTVVEQKIKVEETGNPRVSKRKKENEDISTSKCRRSSLQVENASESTLALGEEEEKRKARLMRNRESAQLSRQRKKHYVEELEDKVRNMHSTITDLNSKIAYFMAENVSLRQQLGGGAAAGGAGMCPPQPMYPPMAPVPYPWVPCPPYVMKPQGSQVPLVPIPRLKAQQPAPAPKAKKTESKKSEGKTKKVASVSFLGLLFFVLLFGGLVPMVNVKYGGIRDSVSDRSGSVGNGFYDSHRGRVLQVSGHLNVSDESRPIGYSRGKLDNSHNVAFERDHGGGSEDRVPGSDEFRNPDNVSEPLGASLYVWRNDKLVKIDGNLIIHSVLASEKAIASREASEIKSKKEGSGIKSEKEGSGIKSEKEGSEIKSKRETGLAVPRDFSPALAIPDARGDGVEHSHVYRNPTERQKALSSGSADALKDHFQSSAADGKMQQWFHEGLAGPMLSSGMCTEVFHLDVSPKPGAIVPASSVASSTEQNQNNTQVNKGQNRRTLRGLPVPVPGSNLNNSGHGGNSQKENFQGNKTASSMVVSVLVDPREGGDGDADSVIKPKSLSKIFVVVLTDSVKYVTYSCVLPRSGPHLVTT